MGYLGMCDKDGCDYNSYRMGDMSFYGHGSDFKIDSSKPVTIVTQFLTHDGTDTSKQKSKFGDLDDFKAKGALREMGAALERGTVLVLSLWDDTDVSMLWLDAAYPSNEPARKPGVLRGP